MLRTALAPHLGALLAEDGVVELMLNLDGRIWVDRLKSGLADTGALLGPADGERIIRLVAHHVGVEAHTLSPGLYAELPETGQIHDILHTVYGERRWPRASLIARSCA